MATLAHDGDEDDIMEDSTNGQKTPAQQPSPTQALVGDAKNIASHLASDAKEAVTKLADDAKGKLEETASLGKDAAVDKIGGVAGALRQTAESLEDAGPIPAIADRAAGELERVAEFVQSRTIGELIHEVEDFGRREPALFLGGSFVLGLIGGRFLKSSAQRAAELSETRAGGESRTGRRGRHGKSGDDSSGLSSSSERKGNYKMGVDSRASTTAGRERAQRP